MAESMWHREVNDVFAHAASTAHFLVFSSQWVVNTFSLCGLMCSIRRTAESLTQIHPVLGHQYLPILTVWSIVDEGLGLHSGLVSQCSMH